MRCWAAAGALLLAAALLNLLPSSSRGSVRSSFPALHVIPFPGTPDVTSSSPVIFSALTSSDLVSVRVTGSRTGVHRGHLATLPDHAGVAFYPVRPFLAGERVTVTARLRSAADGTASGDPGARVLRFSFRIGSPAPAATRPPTLAGAHGAGRPTPARAHSAGPPTQSFHSEPTLHPPLISVSGHLDISSGDVFLTAQNPVQPGPMILDPQGRLVWFEPVSQGQPMNLQVQSYQGHPVLTYWVGVFRQWGEDMILDTSYRTVAVVHGADGLVADLHDFQITRQGTALVDEYKETRANLTGVGGPARGHVLDCIIQELDIRTGRLLWQWQSLGHVPLRASHAPVPTGSAPFDYFHLNSIQQLPNGNLVISARNTWAVYEIDRSTGRIIWTVGGRQPSFHMGSGTGFEWQHDARLNGQTLSLFDDAAAPQEEPESSAKVLHLNLKTDSVSLVHTYTHSPALLANSAGSAQILADGDVFVGWGPQPDFSEYSPSGRQVFNGAFAWGTDSYRGFRFRWRAQPAASPALALAPTSNGGLTLYASWNGATQVRRWQVLAGPAPGQLTPDGSPARRTGFETTIQLSDRPAYVAVQALSASGQVLASSGTQPTSQPTSGGASGAAGRPADTALVRRWSVLSAPFARASP
jgi:hypothetical protein